MRHDGFRGPLSLDQEIEIWSERLAVYERRAQDLTQRFTALPPPDVRDEILRSGRLAARAKATLDKLKRRQTRYG